MSCDTAAELTFTLNLFAQVSNNPAYLNLKVICKLSIYFSNTKSIKY